MPIEFRMPSLGPDMESGTLVEWRVHPGDAIERGDVIALVETDKGIIDVESFQEGTVEKLLIAPDTKVPVGQAIALLSGETSAAATLPAPVTPTATPPPLKQPLATGATRQRISPAARARAKAMGIDLAQVHGTGPNGVVTLQDIERMLSPAATAPSEETPGMRGIIAKAMTRAKRDIPHYYVATAIDFGPARAWLTQHNASVAITERVLPAALVLKAIAHAVRALPDFNGTYSERGFERATAVNIGMAIALRSGGLVAPALLDVDNKDVTALMRELRDLTTRVRSGHMRSSELSQSTITLTSLGDEGVEVVYPIIYPPQVAIVGAGSIVDRPWTLDGVVQVRPIVNISLAADHRVTDGRAGAKFLAHIREALQTPEAL